MSRNKGIACTVIASILFGFLPLSVTTAYETGLNAFDVLFFRFFFAGVIFFSILKLRKESFSVTKKQAKILVVMGIIGYSMMNLSLFLSYNYISVGLASTIHFSYPIAVSILSYFIYKEHLNPSGIWALLLVSAGLLLISSNDFAVDNIIGIVLAFLSAIFFSAYALFTVHPALEGISIWKILFYVSVLTSVILIAIEACAKTTPFHRLTFEGLAPCLTLSVINTVVSVYLFTLGMKTMGPVVACILATLEPITSIFVGIFFLNESINLKMGVGCLLIMVAVGIITRPNERPHLKKDRASDDY